MTALRNQKRSGTRIVPTGKNSLLHAAAFLGRVSGFVLFILPYVFGGELDSLILDHKPQSYPAPLYLKVLSVYEGKLYFETAGGKPSPKSPLYKGIIRLNSPKTYKLRFLYENPFGEERYYGPFVYKLTPPRDFSQKIPLPSIPGGIYDSVLKIKFIPVEKADIFFGLNDSSALAKYSKGQVIKVSRTSTLYYKTVYSDNSSTGLLKEKYEILMGLPKVRLSTKKLKYNYIPKLTVETKNASRAFFSFDPLAPISSFEPVGKYVPVKEGRHTLRLYAENSAGTKSQEVKYRLVIDKTPPRIKYYLNTRTKTINLSSNEPADIYYTLDGSIPSTGSSKYDKPIPISEEGTIPLKFFAVDALGNESKIIWFNASMDKTPPDIQVSPKPGAYSSKLKVRFKCTEACVVRYSLDGTNPVLSHKTVKDTREFAAITKEGPTIIKFFAKDNNGNTTKTYTSRYIVDRTPPKVRFKLIQTAEAKGLNIEFTTDEPAKIYYTTDGSVPSVKSRLYKKGLRISPGTNFKFISVDSLNNTSKVRILKETLKKTVLVSPPGGIYNSRQTISLESLDGKDIYWKAEKDGRPIEGEDFKPYVFPLHFIYAGTYALSFYVDEKDGEKNIQQQMYIIDKSPPQVVPYLEKSSSDSIFYLDFETDEPTKIYYTLDGSIPTLENGLTIGSEYKNQNLRIRIVRKGKQVLHYFGVDRAQNHSKLFELDLFSPYVTAQPPPGEYHSILSLKLISQPGNTIYFGRDSLTLSVKSSAYSKPILIKESREVWFFAVDISGFPGPKQRAFYKLYFPPQPQFSPLQENVVVGKDVLLDGKLSADEETPLERLKFRWDLNGDGQFDTPFKSESQIITRFIAPGARFVTLEVMDEDSLTNQIRNNIMVHKNCPSDMVSITAEDAYFCIDQYEWPNKKDATPLSGINWAEASMLCLEKGRRLCGKLEWELACKGKFDYFFSYANTYDKGKCNTNSQAVTVSGANAGCRSTGHVYDQIGNLWEWIEEADKNEHYIMGGSYEQSSASSCELSFPSKISTKSPSIGFRCCQ